MKVKYCPQCGKKSLESNPEEYHLGWYCENCEEYFNVLAPAWQNSSE